jgi:hypothetical protein
MHPAVAVALLAMVVLAIWGNLRGVRMSKHNRPERPPEVEIDIDNKLPESVRHDIHEIRECLCKIARLFEQFVLHPATGLQLAQIIGGSTMPITGVQAGATGVFQETPQPVGGALQAGAVPVWTVDDPTVTLTPSTDGTQVAAAVPATSTAASFNLTATTTSSNGSTITGTANVPVLPAAVTPATSLQIDQLS